MTKRDDSPIQIKAALITGVFAVIAAVVAGIFLLLNTFFQGGRVEPKLTITPLTAAPPPQATAIAAPAVEIAAYCSSLGQSPTYVQANQPIVLRWSWRAATDAFRQDYIAATSFALQIDGQSVDISSAIRTLVNDPNSFIVTWRLPPRFLTVGTHRVVLISTFNRQVKDGFDSNNDGTLDTYGPGVTTSSPCEIIVTNGASSICSVFPA